MSNHSSRTTSANRIHDRVEPIVRTATITSPNSYRRSLSGDLPVRSSNSIRKASKAIKSNPQVSSRANSIKPQSASRRLSKSSSARSTVHSNEREIVPANSASARTTVQASRHFRKREKTTGSFITAYPRTFFPFAELPDYILDFFEATQAKHEAAKSRSRFQQPSQALRASSNARGRNYSARSAKRKPLSGTSVSSRKRSSGA